MTSCACIEKECTTWGLRTVCLREVHYFSIHAHLGVDYPDYTMATSINKNIRVLFHILG